MENEFGYDKSSLIRVRINRSEFLMLKQLINKTCPDKDLSDFHGERQAIHSFAEKLHDVWES